MKPFLSFRVKSKLTDHILFLPIVTTVIFFFFATITLPNYGISWDEPIHWHRGQSYLHYFLTGSLDYKDLPKVAEHYPRYDSFSITDPVVSVSDYRRSYYQADSLTASYFLEHDGGHPPLNDILAALTNYIFYQKLGIMGDIESHHLFNILASSVLVFVVVLFAKQAYGNLAAVISGMSLITYPLFWSEAHFNIKDPPQAAFFALCIWAFWYSLETKKARWLIVSAFSFGVSFGMKFNILFAPFILGAYTLTVFRNELWKNILRPWRIVSRIPKKFFVSLILAPFIIAVIFVIPWPYLWPDVIGNFSTIFGYYKAIGTGSFYTSSYSLAGFHLYPVLWIIVTTPPIVLLLFAVGVFSSLFEIKKGKFTSLLWLLWFLVPVLRISVPGASIYGGIRQIFEYIPAMSLLAGLGAVNLFNFFGLKKLSLIVAVVIFIPHIFVLQKLHPHENVYFNSLIGGLKGASAVKIPYWGNSFGNAYKDMIDWLNKNAPEDAKLALVQGTGLNLPRIMLRPDIKYWNDHWSGILRQGEYMMELTHGNQVNAYPYAWEYIEKTLKPVYEVKVDGVAIAKIWKNDKENSKAEYQFEEKAFNTGFFSVFSAKEIHINLSRKSLVTRLQVENVGEECVLPDAAVFTSIDSGKSWYREPESLLTPSVGGVKPWDKKRVVYFLPMRNANAIKIEFVTSQNCFNSKSEVTIFELSQ